MKACIDIAHPQAANSVELMLKSVGYNVYMKKNRNNENMFWRLGYEVGGTPVGEWDDNDLYVTSEKEQIAAKRHVRFICNGGPFTDGEPKGPNISSNFNLSDGFVEYLPFCNVLNIRPREKRAFYDKPISLVHNVGEWGFGASARSMQEDINLFGLNSPRGLLKEHLVPDLLRQSLCLAHLKPHDAPGFALYFAFASAVPIVIPETFIKNSRYEDLLIDGETCYVFGKGVELESPNDGAGDKKHVESIRKDLLSIFEKLRDPDENYRIGLNGLFKWKELTRWTSKKRDRFAEFLKINNLLQ